MILNGFSLLSCLSPSILLLDGGLQTGVFDSRDVSKAVSCITSEDKGFSFRCSAGHQNFRIWPRNIMPFPFVFKCSPFLPR